MNGIITHCYSLEAFSVYSPLKTKGNSDNSFQSEVLGKNQWCVRHKTIQTLDGEVRINSDQPNSFPFLQNI